MKCTICLNELTIPADAVCVRRRYGLATYMWDKQVHVFNIRKKPTASPPTPAPIIPAVVQEPDIELLHEVVNVLTELPQPEVIEPKPESVIESVKPEPELKGIMAYAFLKGRKIEM